MKVLQIGDLFGHMEQRGLSEPDPKIIDLQRGTRNGLRLTAVTAMLEVAASLLCPGCSTSARYRSAPVVPDRSASGPDAAAWRRRGSWSGGARPQ
jgi:hypothetical protein